MSKKSNKLWGGVHASTDVDAVNFASASDVTGKSVPENKLVPYDIQTNLAHVKMLQKTGRITLAESKQLIDALKKLLKEYEIGTFVFDPKYEDIHSQIESVITERVGEAGKKIHTARSRNDQVTTDMYLYVHDNINIIVGAISELAGMIDKSVKKYMNVVCPGYTHHQKAVVTSFGDILDAYSVMFKRDVARLKQTKQLYNYSPLGASTGYESLLHIDRNYTAKELGFSVPYKNSIDVISTRGEFEAAFAHGISQFMTHVSMLSQTLITFSSQAYNYVSLADGYTTGSSVMPQKKNPDLLEIMKAKNAYAHSVASGLTSLLQASFVGYNRDSQYSKMLIMQLVEEVQLVPTILSRIINTMTVNKDIMLNAASTDFVTSTGFMELLVSEKQLALRDAKRLVEKAVAFSIKANSNLISKDAIDYAIKQTGVKVSLNEQQLLEWQNPEFQLERCRNASR